MLRNEIELITDERFSGISGLWLAVLMALVDDLSNPGAPGHHAAVRAVHDMEHPIPIVASMLKLDPEALRKRIIRAVEHTQRGQSGAIRHRDRGRDCRE